MTPLPPNFIAEKFGFSLETTDSDSWQYACGYMRGIFGEEIRIGTPTLPHLMGYIDAIFDTSQEHLLTERVKESALTYGIDLAEVLDL